jgi:hypothetical protein
MVGSHSRTWSFSTIAAVPSVPCASNVSMEWSRCCLCMSLYSVAMVFVTYVERRKVCAVAVELRIVELDELLCERGQSQSKLRGMRWEAGSDILPTASKAARTVSRMAHIWRGSGRQTYTS